MFRGLSAHREEEGKEHKQRRRTSQDQGRYRGTEKREQRRGPQRVSASGALGRGAGHWVHRVWGPAGSSGLRGVDVAASRWVSRWCSEGLRAGKGSRKAGPGHVCT